MRGLLTFGGSAVLVGLVLWTSAALLPACGVGNRIPASWADWCPAEQAAPLEARIAALSEQNRTLEQTIFERERALARKQCQRAEPAALLPEAIDRDAWESGEIGLLEGCWDLESRFTTTHQTTGVQSTYTEWTICFDATGQGQEQMRAQNGSSCQGPVQAGFESGGLLAIEEPGNLECSDGGFIYRLSSRCTLTDETSAHCVVSQPEVGGRTTVKFRRSAREN